MPNLNIEQATELISRALRTELENVDGEFRAESKFIGPTGDLLSETLVLPEDVLRKSLDSLAAKDISDQTVIYDDNCYEVLVREESPHPGGWLRRSRSFPLSIHDNDLGVHYGLGWPSSEFILLILGALRETEILGDFFGRMMPRRMRSSEQLEILEDGSPSTATSILDLLRQSSPRLNTLRISVDKPRNLSQFQTYADSFLFHLSFNLDTSFVPVRSLEELVRRSRIRRNRRARIDELDPPRRAYVGGLIYHYQMAVSTDNPPLEFLSYFHVAESFFESVFHDELINSVRDRLTRPDFSYRRTTDVRALINHVSDRLRLRQNEVTFSEQEALRLTLARFVNVAELKIGLEQIDSSLIPRYRQEKVGFSGGDPVDLDTEDEEQIYRKLAGRIYKTRNAVVHSKEGGKLKYVPFTHDSELLQEVPLMRLVAEQIIVRSARDLT